MSNIGDFIAGATVRMDFTTVDTDGAPITLAGTPVAKAYKNDSTTETATGVALTVDFDGVTGSHHVAVDTSADGTFYAAGSDFVVKLTAGTADGVSVVGAVVGRFSIENRCQKADVRKYGGTSGTFASGRPEVNLNGDLTATMKTSIGTVVAASAVASVTGNVGGDILGDVNGDVKGDLVGSVLGGVAGNLLGSVANIAAGGITSASFANNAITAASIAGNAITAGKVDSSAVDEIQSGLATEGLLSEVGSTIAGLINGLPTAAANAAALLAATTAEGLTVDAILTDVRAYARGPVTVVNNNNGTFTFTFKKSNSATAFTNTLTTATGARA